MPARALPGEIALRDLPYDPRYLQPLSGRYFQIARIGDGGALDVQVISPSLFDVDDSISIRKTAGVAGRAGRGARARDFLDIDGPGQRAAARDRARGANSGA